MNQLLYVCLDGLGDDPIPELDGRTPLEAARTPVLDGLARRGSSGLVYLGPSPAHMYGLIVTITSSSTMILAGAPATAGPPQLIRMTLS